MDEKEGKIYEVDDLSNSISSCSSIEEDESSIQDFIISSAEDKNLDEMEEDKDENTFTLKIKMSISIVQHQCEDTSDDDVESKSKEKVNVQPKANQISCLYECHYICPQNYGRCPIYSIDGGISFVQEPYPALYCYQGRKLKMLNCHKYTALVCTIKNKPKEKQRGKSGDKTEQQISGRRKSKKFPFSNGITIWQSYHQILRTKHCTPKFYHYPPSHPGPKPIEENNINTWKKEAGKFGC